mmetsp:Transcript_3004/g.8480  ORF Transcript_3004/g.8480 Transcript_3004/m.8480 type:complete len:163 (-) Transcript_3004:516-1004(-)
MRASKDWRSSAIAIVRGEEGLRMGGGAEPCFGVDATSCVFPMPGGGAPKFAEDDSGTATNIKIDATKAVIAPPTPDCTPSFIRASGMAPPNQDIFAKLIENIADATQKTQGCCRTPKSNDIKNTEKTPIVVVTDVSCKRFVSSCSGLNLKKRGDTARQRAVK